MIALPSLLLLATPIPPEGQTEEWKFVNYFEVISEQDFEVKCEFRSFDGESYRVEFLQHGATDYFRGGFAEWPGAESLPRFVQKGEGELSTGAVRFSDVYGTIPGHNEILIDETGYFEGTELPRLDDWTKPILSADGSARLRLFVVNLQLAFFSDEHVPTILEAELVPPPPISQAIGSPKSDDANARVAAATKAKAIDTGSLAGFCSFSRELQTLPFEFLDELGKKNK